MYKVYIEKDCVYQTGLILTDPDGKLYRRELDLFHEDVIYIIFYVWGPFLFCFLNIYLVLFLILGYKHVVNY